MPTLYAGQTLPLSVAAGQTLVVKELSGTATVTGSVAAREDASSSIGAGFVVYGPQPSAVSLSITTTGLCEWRVVNGDATPASQPVYLQSGSLVTGDGTAVGAAVAAALGITLDAQGDIVANIVPRTGWLASLLSLAGGAGEIASATDAPALVKLTGTAGGAVALMPFGTVRVQAITAVSYAFPALTIKPDARVVTISPTNVGSGTATVSAGTFIGQPLRIMMLVGGGGGTLSGIPVDGGTVSISSNQAFDLVWTGTAWHLENQTTFAGNGLGSFGLFQGIASGAGAIAIGANAGAVGAGSFSIGPVTAAGIGEVAIAAGTKASRHLIGLRANTTTAASKELTADGAAATATNRYKPAAAGGTAVARVKATISGKDSAGNNICQFVREAVILSDGTTATLVNSPTPVADVVSGITGTPGATLGVSGANLTVSVVGSTQSIQWSALVESVEMVVS